LEPKGRRHAPRLLLGAVLLAVTSHYFHLPKLTERYYVVLADFTNTTGDDAFDDALKQALSEI
jgi:hypothetical protein